MRTVEWRGGRVAMIDQRALPHELIVVEYADYRQVAAAIRDMVVRGAPAIGVTAAMGLALAALRSTAADRPALLRDLETAAKELRASRPTAVNLGWALDRLLRRATEESFDNADAIRTALVAEANAWLAARGVRLVRVATQGRNRAAINFYAGCGFRIGDVELIFHRWF